MLHILYFFYMGGLQCAVSQMKASRLRDRELMGTGSQSWRGSTDLIEVLEALVRQRDGDAENGVGGVLVEARFTVSPEESQSPAPEGKIKTQETQVSSQKEKNFRALLGKANELCLTCVP